MPSNRRQPIALTVSRDGQVAVAVYAFGTPGRRIVAAWRLNREGRCETGCRPDHFPIGVGKPQTDGDGSARFDLDLQLPYHTYDIHHSQAFIAGDDILYVEPSRAPVRVSLQARGVIEDAAVIGSDAPVCSASATPLPPPKPVPPAPGQIEIPLFPPVAPPATGQFAVVPGENGVSALTKDGSSAVEFYRWNRQIARLDVPDRIACSGGCDVHTVFLDGGRRAFVARDSGRVYGVLSLDTCKLDEWPAAATLRPEAPSFLAAKHGARIHRVNRLAPSTDGAYVAGVLTFSIDRYRAVLAIYSVAERRLVSASVPADGSDVMAVRPGTDAAFLAFTESAVVAVSASGTAEQTIPAEGRLTASRTGDSFVWRAGGDNAADLDTIRTLKLRPLGFSAPVPFYGRGLRAVSVSSDGKQLAFAQNGVVLLQGVGADALESARRVDGIEAETTTFSPNGGFVGASWHSGWRDRNTSLPAAITVWRTANAREVGTYRPTAPAKLAGVLNDGTALVEEDEGLVVVDVVGGGRRQVLGRSAGSYETLAAGDGLIISASQDGTLWRLDPSGQVAELAASDTLKGKRVVAVNGDASLAYVSDRNADYFFDVRTGTLRAFLRNTATGFARFAPDGTLALVVDRNTASQTSGSVQLWNATASAPLETYTGSWEKNLNYWQALAAVWFRDSGSELWALDYAGRMHRWSLVRRYESDFAMACLTLRNAGARLEVTDEELADLAALRRSDRAPCFRTGLLSLTFYRGLLDDLLAALRRPRTSTAECQAIADPSERDRCAARYRDVWDRLEKLAAAGQ